MPDDNDNDEASSPAGSGSGEVPDPQGPCRCAPGTEGKVAALVRRREQGYALWHPEDLVRDDERDDAAASQRGPSVTMQRNPLSFLQRNRAGAPSLETD